MDGHREPAKRLKGVFSEKRVVDRASGVCLAARSAQAEARIAPISFDSEKLGKSYSDSPAKSPPRLRWSSFSARRRTRS